MINLLGMNALEIRVLNEHDYSQTLVRWWMEWGWTPPKRDFLPDDGKGGFIVFDDDIPVCAGFMYVTNSKVAWVDWIISNKKYTDRDKRDKALDILLQTLVNLCNSLEKKYIYALIKHPNLINRYKKHGFILGDTYTGEMIKQL
jgi:hypothetical protein